MLTIHLHNLSFYSFHGLYPEEKKLGASYELNVDVDVVIVDKVAQISDTIDYSSIYTIISEKMKIPTELLETLAENISEAIFQKDQRIKKVSVNIIKLNPPIQNFQGKLSITYSKEL